MGEVRFLSRHIRSLPCISLKSKALSALKTMLLLSFPRPAGKEKIFFSGIAHPTWVKTESKPDRQNYCVTIILLLANDL